MLMMVVSGADKATGDFNRLEMALRPGADAPARRLLQIADLWQQCLPLLLEFVLQRGTLRNDAAGDDQRGAGLRVLENIDRAVLPGDDGEGEMAFLEKVIHGCPCK